MHKDKFIHIAYIGRLEKEKGIEIVIECIKRAIVEERRIIWHICGEGSYLRELRMMSYELRMGKNTLEKSKINIYGHVDQEKMREVLSITDLVLMPSLFLETFGLVALETLSHGVPVCGFVQGGLSDFIHPLLAMNRDDPVNSFFRILYTGEFPVLDVSSFSHEHWISRLQELTKGVNRILLVNDYIGLVGGAEQYVSVLAGALRSIGKTVEIHGYRGNTGRLNRIFLMVLAPLAFWRGNILNRHIHEFQPDGIWMHSVLRYIGPHGVQTISDYKCPKYITHHDLGLITPRPSQIYSEGDIPSSPSLGDWIPKRINIFSIMIILLKWSYIQLIWRSLSRDSITHIVPSAWMVSYFQKYSHTLPIVYPHAMRDEKNSTD